MALCSEERRLSRKGRFKEKKEVDDWWDLVTRVYSGFIGRFSLIHICYLFFIAFCLRKERRVVEEACVFV
jgi:hypothetical protein